MRLIGTDSDGAEFELTVIAPQALVLGGQSLPRPEGLSDTGVQLDAGGRGLLIWWPALPCQDRPVITLAGIDDGVTIQVDKGPREESVCQMNEVQLTVQLRLAREISSVEMAP